MRTALTPKERELLALAGLDELAPSEAWTVLGTSRALAYSTHGAFHQRPAVVSAKAQLARSGSYVGDYYGLYAIAQ